MFALDHNDSVDGGESPVYDAEGNNTAGSQGQTLVYDAWNRMVAIKVGSTVKIAYEYDGLFRRIQETVGTTVHSQYFSASWQIIEERVKVGTGAEQIRVQNVWSAVYSDAMVLRDRDSDADGTLEERVYPLFDANFNVSSIVDEEGAVLERYRYEPYGDRVVLNPDFAPDTLAGSDSTTSDDTEAGWNTSDVLFRHGHQGGAYDRVASEKMLFRFRTLDTQQMRWGQVDPLRYVDGMNAYEGYRSSPLMWTDPRGTDIDKYDMLNVTVGSFVTLTAAAGPAGMALGIAAAIVTDDLIDAARTGDHEDSDILDTAIVKTENPDSG